MPSRPSAVASRRAGSIVSTSTLPPSRLAAPSAAAAATDVLPTPPEPQNTTISFAASSCSSVVDRGSARAHRPELLAERVGDHARHAQAVRAHEQIRHVEQRQVDRVVAARSRCAAPRAPQRDREPGARRAPRSRPAPARAVSIGAPSGSRSASNVSSSAWVNSSGSTRLTITVAERHRRPRARSRCDELDRLRDRHLLGRRHDVDRGDRGIGEQLDEPLGLRRAPDRRRRAPGSRRPRRAGRRCDRSRPRRRSTMS